MLAGNRLSFDEQQYFQHVTFITFYQYFIVYIRPQKVDAVAGIV
jgi:hypothetical protein